MTSLAPQPLRLLGRVPSQLIQIRFFQYYPGGLRSPLPEMFCLWEGRWSHRIRYPISTINSFLISCLHLGPLAYTSPLLPHFTMPNLSPDHSLSLFETLRDRILHRCRPLQRPWTILLQQIKYCLLQVLSPQQFRHCRGTGETLLWICSLFDVDGVQSGKCNLLAIRTSKSVVLECRWVHIDHMKSPCAEQQSIDVVINWDSPNNFQCQIVASFVRTI